MGTALSQPLAITRNNPQESLILLSVCLFVSGMILYFASKDSENCIGHKSCKPNLVNRLDWNKWFGVAMVIVGGLYMLLLLLNQSGLGGGGGGMGLQG